MIDKGTNILIKHNDKVYNISCKEIEDDDNFNIRSRTLSDIVHKKRGYGKHKTNVLQELRKQKQCDQKI